MMKVSEAVVRRCFVKKVFLEISQKIHRKTPVPESIFNKVAGLGLFLQKASDGCFCISQQKSMFYKFFALKLESRFADKRETEKERGRESIHVLYFV